MSAISLKSYEFRRERAARWRELDYLVQRAERVGIRGLGPRELMRLPVLHRAAISSLSVARSISLDSNAVEYLEGLCLRAHLIVYGSKRGLARTVIDFARFGFPRAVRAFAGPIALSAAFLLLGSAVGFVLTARDLDAYYSLVEPAIAQGRDPSTPVEKLRSQLYERYDGTAMLTAFAAFLFSHNSEVGLLSLALGFLGGVPVFFLLLSNGIILGAFAALYHARGLSVDLWGWLLPHGVPEITAIVIFGAAGLALGRAVVWPGRHRRLENLAIAGRAIAPLAIGGVGMLFAAGLTEGIFRQTVTSVAARYATALIVTLSWLSYFLFAGRGRRASEV
jgi:uncharacterized membrane protein SpoIIM required for sporulation